jgi:hypothetical protein
MGGDPVRNQAAIKAMSDGQTLEANRQGFGVNHQVEMIQSFAEY